jgi:GH25 family lysozyme M1 (1,4-beta-N-acetylmuramidase)
VTARERRTYPGRAGRAQAKPKCLHLGRDVEEREASSPAGLTKRGSGSPGRVGQGVLTLGLCVLSIFLAMRASSQPSQELKTLGRQYNVGALEPVRAVGLPARNGAAGESGADLSRTVIDMSSHNASLPITDTLRATFGIELIFHRATIGVGTGDTLFRARVKQSYDQGFSIGAYHVAYPGHSGVDQADWFVSSVKRACQANQTVLLAVDWEQVCLRWDAHKRQCVREGIVSGSVVSDFENEVRALTGKSAMVYVGRETIDAHRSEIGGDLASAPLWLPTYYTKFWRRPDAGDAGGDVIAEPIGNREVKSTRLVSRIGYVIPLPDDVRPWIDWTFWQFGEGKGPNVTSKISLTVGKEPVDMSFYNGSRAAFRSFVAENAWDCKTRGVSIANREARHAEMTQPGVAPFRSSTSHLPNWPSAGEQTPG